VSATGVGADPGVRGNALDFLRLLAAELSIILIASVALADALKNAAPLVTDGISAFQHIGLTEQDCAVILTQAKQHLGSLRDALGG
jgi:hypothetical protein